MKLSEHFSDWEFKCRCCGKLYDENSVHDGMHSLTLCIDALEELRRITGRVINVSCGYRCDIHNKDVGGASNSYHKKGLAADIVIVGLTPVQMYKHADKISVFGGIGIYPENGFIHVDCRTNGPARWAKVNGVYVSIEEVLK